MSEYLTHPTVEPTIHAFLDSLESWDELKYPNWNNYNAKPLSADAIKYARIIADAMEKGGVFVAPLACGGVQIEWENKDGDYFEIEIHPDGQIKGYATRIKKLLEKFKK